MATYVPDATDETQPTGDKTVKSAAQEFRTFKTRMLRALTVPETLTAPYSSIPDIATRAGKALVFDAGGNPSVASISGTADPSLRADLADTADVAKNDALLGVKSTRTGATATTQHQVNEEAFNVFRVMTAAQIAVISAGAGDAGAECATAFQAALDSGASFIPLPDGRYLFATQQRIKSGTARVFLRGGHRVKTILSPSVTSLSVAPVSVNAMFVVQDNNAHWCLENVRFFSSVGFTGVGIYCKEGGGSDATCQALFSAIFRNLWIDFSSPNAGFLTGAVQNSIFDTAVCENMKGLFTIEGVGNADNFWRNWSLYNCYDHFITQVADTTGSSLLSFDGIHAYTHLRGRLFDVQNWKQCTIRDVLFEPDAANLGSTGLFKFKDCSGVSVIGAKALTRAGVPACAIGIELNTHAGKFTDVQVNADVGLLLVGTGAQDLVFENVDFTQCTTAALRINAAVTGKIITRGCKFSDSTLSGILTSVANALSWYSYDDEFINAGLGGSASSRNITLETSGEVIFTRPRIGRDNGSAAAGYFLEANGSGTVTLVDPVWVGTPPTGRITGSQQVAIRITQRSDVVTVTDATYTVDDSDVAIVADRAGTVTLTLPDAGAHAGRQLIVKTQQAQAVASASSNVIAPTGGAAGTAILAAVDGASTILIADAVTSAWHAF